MRLTKPIWISRLDLFLIDRTATHDGAAMETSRDLAPDQTRLDLQTTGLQPGKPISAGPARPEGLGQTLNSPPSRLGREVPLPRRFLSNDETTVAYEEQVLSAGFRLMIRLSFICWE